MGNATSTREKAENTGKAVGAAYGTARGVATGQEPREIERLTKEGAEAGGKIANTYSKIVVESRGDQWDRTKKEEKE
jgi:hypothetical protein